jgi:hypothetical protein
MASITAHISRLRRAQDVPAWRSARLWRWINLILAVIWLAMVPISIMTGWIYSIAFISAASMYANFVSHIAGWRADEPVEAEPRPGSMSAPN